MFLWNIAVTSLAEVWIEICENANIDTGYRGHFPCGSVDWNTWNILTPQQTAVSLPLRKCGLKFYLHYYKGCGSEVTSLAEVWIEILIVLFYLLPCNCHFPCGSVDWNSIHHTHTCFCCMSLPLRKCGLKFILTQDKAIMYGHFPCGSVDWNNLNHIHFCI